ncbi:unnamed protein product [Protopolystoma xenopodis]|uniref:Uncharacterized protein n=1 Tax=Protopolystoma xenopodis TaxID=117903 RepID=A0A3S5A818_9PLAT|nr:unnamed protein product [Protopolystoma xenopodis]
MTTFHLSEGEISSPITLPFCPSTLVASRIDGDCDIGRAICRNPAFESNSVSTTQVQSSATFSTSFDLQLRFCTHATSPDWFLTTTI